MHVSNHDDTPNHASHDTFLIAGHAAGDLIDSDRTRAQALLTACSTCQHLHRDLVAIATATRSLPNLATAPRDFRLSAEQAARLRRGSWLRAALAPFGAARSATRPLAATFTSLGIAGLLIGSALPTLMGGAASAPERDNALGAATAPTAEAAGVPQAGAPTFEQDRVNVPVSAASGSPQFGSAQGGAKATDLDAAYAGGADNGAQPTGETLSQSDLRALIPAPNPVLVGSLAVLVLGLALFGLRMAARRLR